MIVGVGSDIVEISRVASLHERYGDRFLERVFTEREAAYSLSGARPAARTRPRSGRE